MTKFQYMYHLVTLLLLKPSTASDGQAISASISGQGGGVVCHSSQEILTIACLTFCLLLTDSPTLGLPETN